MGDGLRAEAEAANNLESYAKSDAKRRASPLHPLAGNASRRTALQGTLMRLTGNSVQYERVAQHAS